MSTHSDLIAVIGSLRRRSFNRTVFEAAVELVPPGSTLLEIPVAEVPLFNQDLEVDPDPGAVRDLKSAVADADGLIFFTPEYNHSVPAVTKNALDWLSRPVGASAISGKPVGIVAASPGGGAGGGVREHLAHSAGILTDRLFPEAHGIGRVGDAIADGRLTDPGVRDQLQDWLHRFVDHVETLTQEVRVS